jgi:hypothetical protein
LPRSNRATRIIASTLGVLLGVGGLDHGILEAMQGNSPTGGLLINALAAGTSWSVLKQGGEGAFTVIPNLLVTGILSVAAALAVIIWSAFFIHRRLGSLVLLFLCLFLVLVGGGIAQIPFIAITLAVSTRIRSPLRWWRRILPAGFRRAIARAWPVTLVFAAVLLLAAIEMAVIGYVPGTQNIQVVLSVTWSVLGAVILLTGTSVVSGFSDDIERSDAEPRGSPQPSRAQWTK